MASRWRRRMVGTLAGVAIAAAGAGVLAVPYLVDHREPVGAEAAASPLTWPEELRPPAPEPGTPRRRLAPPERGVYLGVSNHHLAADDGALEAWARAQGPRPRIVNWFQQWLSGERRFRADWARRVAEAGAVPMITWEPWYAPAGERHVAEQPAVSLARIADGAHDDVVRAWARDVAEYGQPVLIRLMHEMNGDWYPWGVAVNGNSAADYVRAYRHVHRVFDAAGADNVSWVWSINNLERIPGADHAIGAYYPGDRWVDWVSTSGFNWGTAYGWSSWRTADALYRDTYEALARFGKPIMISEMGTTGLGGDARTWVRQTLATLRTGYPLLRAVLWYDDVDAAGLDFRLRGPLAGALAQPNALGTGWVRNLRHTRLPG